MRRVVFVRHGQASYLEPPYDRLTATGTRQMSKLAQYWLARGVRFDRVFCGPALRHRQSEQIVAEAYVSSAAPWPPVTVMESFDEFPAEAVVKRAIKDLARQSPEVASLVQRLGAAKNPSEKREALDQLVLQLTRSWAAGEFGHESIESWQDFYERICGALRQVLESVGEGAQVVVFTSAGPIAAAFAETFRVPAPQAIELAFSLYNSATAEFEFDGSQVWLGPFNNVAHLDDLELLTRR